MGLMVEEEKKEEKSDWEKKLEPRKANIGFLTRSDAFAEPTPAQRAAALAHETKSWQASIGKTGDVVFL